MDIGKRREVCWDEYLIDKAENVKVQMHHPEYRGVALHCDAPWEGNCCCYFVLIPESDQMRLYYRGCRDELDEFDNCRATHRTYFCYAESRDGKQFHRVSTKMIPYAGQENNNIIMDNIPDNIYFFYDTNPDCRYEERYKGLAQIGDQELWYFKSADGVHFEKERMLCNDGAYDSMNVAFWDEKTQQYFLFFRGVHGGGSQNGKWTAEETRLRHNTVVRDVRVRTSKDFVHWNDAQMITFSPEREDTELYTNQIQKYYRARDMFIGFPARYVDRYGDPQNFPHLPDWKKRQGIIRKFGREGTVMTDAMIMTSRDGYTFRRTDEAFLTAGIERGCNWYYGDGFLCYGMAETESDIPGAPNEISLYMGQCYRAKDVELARYAIRLDGFFSWRCDYEPGVVLTRPIRFEGNALSINFATSAAGYVRIRLLDADGAPIEGYDSGCLFGNSVDRTVDFSEALEKLAGKEVRMEISMRDADLYSFRFNEIPTIF